ncbi:hypothetical protein MtrunA17_Chr5g0414611 [Medicago truncatula]|uniref:Uncharacterized protein n=1 Tax=Medicago truncatula TaxID=3880 RepID=A0A396HRL4_MEDTR|nr:hypothetical protein MtrunA17_Chr5g0414611 [Medicago truncatula]
MQKQQTHIQPGVIIMSSSLFLPSLLLFSHFHHHHRISYLPPTAPKPSSISNKVSTKTITRKIKDREKG